MVYQRGLLMGTTTRCGPETVVRILETQTSGRGGRWIWVNHTTFKASASSTVETAVVSRRVDPIQWYLKTRDISDRDLIEPQTDLIYSFEQKAFEKLHPQIDATQDAKMISFALQSTTFHQSHSVNSKRLPKPVYSTHWIVFSKLFSAWLFSVQLPGFLRHYLPRLLSTQQFHKLLDLGSQPLNEPLSVWSPDDFGRCVCSYNWKLAGLPAPRGHLPKKRGRGRKSR